MSCLAACALVLFAGTASAQTAADEWETPEFAQPAVEEELPPFDASKVAVDGRPRFEANVGAWLAEGASRLRTTQPLLGVGVSLRPMDRLRLDAGYRFSFGGSGTKELSVFNTLHALRLRAHWALPVGGAWFTAGGGPVGYLLTSSTSAGGQGVDAGVKPGLGVEVALGMETQVSQRLVRFEAFGASRGARVDLGAGLALGF